MATKSYIALPPVAAVFGWLFLVLPTGLFAQVTPGDLAACTGLFEEQFIEYMAEEETYVDSGCFRSQGSVYIAREGLSGSTTVQFYAFADMKQCWVEDEISVVGTIYGLSGGDVAAWKKYLLNEACDMVTYVAPEKRIIFVTSLTFTGNLIQEAKNVGIKGKISSGLEAADKICTKLANDAGLPGDTYTAWLSDTTTHASDRVVHSDVPYVWADGLTQIVADFDALLAVGSTYDCSSGPCLSERIVMDETKTEWTGNPMLEMRTWTGTEGSGSFSGGADCDNWTTTTTFARSGVPYFTTRQWTSSDYPDCSDLNHLYCFQD